MVENACGVWVAAWRDIGACLLVEPPRRQAEFSRDRPGLVKHRAMRLEDGVDIPGRPARVIGQGHRRPAEYVHIADQPASGQPLAKPPEGPFDGRPV